MSAVQPASRMTSSVSGKGKNASLATTAPSALLPACLTAMRAELTRLGWPPPIPTVACPFVSTIALDLMHLQQRQANSSSSSCSSVGCVLVGTVKVAGSSVTASVDWMTTPPSMLRMSYVPPAGLMPPVLRMRAFFFCAKTSSASSS